MELPADTQFLVINLEQCIPSSADQVAQNETKGFPEGSEVTPSKENPSGETIITKDKQGASETSEEKCSTLRSLYIGYYGEIFSYLMMKSFPDGASDSLKRMLKRSSQYYCVIDGILHYGHKNPKKVVSDKEEQRKILARSHIEEGTGVHRGAKKMYKFINSTVFWRYLYVDITNYIKECTKCVDFGHENDVNNAEPVKHDWPKSSHIWEKVCVQILGPYPKTANRNEFVVTIVDPVSQWIVAQPIAFDSSLASQVACLIFKTFCDFGFTECTINSVPPQISSDILSKLKKYEKCLYKVTAALGVPVDASQICNLVKCQDEIIDCVWLNELFSTWVQNNPCSWDKDLDEFLFEFRALPKNGAPSPFCAMFNRRPVQCIEANKENVLHQNLVPVLSKRRKLQGSLMKCRHCDEVFTSKMSFRIHQRRHTEDAKRRGLMEGEDLFKNTDHENIEDYGPKVLRRSANQNASDPASGSVANSWKRLKKITNKGSRTQIGKPQLREEVQKQLRANAVAAVKNIILATKDARKKRGKYQKYPQDVQEEMARYAIQHGILKTTRHFSERLSVRVCHSTIRNIVKLHCCFTPQLKDEIGRFAAGFGVEAASRHFSERLGREVRQGLVRKFKKHYVARLSDSTGKNECDGHPSTVSGKHRNVLDEKLRKEIGKHACEVGISSTVNYFLEKHSLNLKESLIRRLRKQYLERNKHHANGTALPEVYQDRQYANSEETERTYQGNSNVVHAFYANQVYHSASHIQTNDSLLPQQNSSLPFNTINNTTNSAGVLAYHQVPPSTTSVVVSQDSLSVSIYQQPEQVYSSVTHEGHVIQGSAIPVSSSSIASVPPHFQFQSPPVTAASDSIRNNEAALQPEHHIQQVSCSSAITTETTVAAVHVVPSLSQKQQTQGDSSSSPHSLQPQAVVIHQSHHSNTIESSYPATVVQAVGDKMTVLSALDACGASAMADRDCTYTVATCIPTGEKSMYKPKTFHFPVSHLDTVAMAVCRDDNQIVNDVVITIVPSSENDKTSHKGNAPYQDCQKVSNSNFLLEKDQDHVYQEQLIKQQAHVIPVQLQQHIENFHENQSHKQDLQQEQPLEHLQQHKNHVSEPQVLHLQQQQPLLQEQQVKTSHKYKQLNSQHQELPQKPVYQHNQQQSHETQQQLFQLQQQSDCPTPQTHQHQQLFLLQTHLPQEQSQKQTRQQSQQYSQQMQQHVLQQPVQLQEPQESLQHLKKHHLYHTQQQLFLLQPHLNSDQLQKPVHQENQLQLLQFQEQLLKEQTKDSLQQQKQKLHGHQHKLIQVQQLVNSQQSQESVDEQKQQSHQLQQPVFQLQLQFDHEQQTSAREQNQEHSHQSQLYLSQEQAQKPTQQQKQQHLHQPQHEVLQLQQKFSQEQPLRRVHQQKQQHLHQSHQVIQLHQLVQEQVDVENPEHLHQSEHQVLHLQQQLVQEQPQELKHQEKHQYLHQSEHRILHLQQRLTQEQPQEPTDERKKQHLHQSEHQICKLQQHVDQEQMHKTLDKEKQHLHQSQRKALQLQQQFDQEQPQEPTHKADQQQLYQSQHQVLLLQQQLDQGQPNEPTHEEKQQHLHQSQHQVLHLEQHLDHEESHQSVHQEKEQSLHHSEHQVVQLQQQLDHDQPLESVHQKKQLLHLSQHHMLQLQKHLVQDHPQDTANQGEQQNFHQSEQQALQLQQHLGHKQQEVMQQEKQNYHQSHHEELQLQQQELTHQDTQKHLDQSHQETFHLQHQLSQEQPLMPSHKEKQQFLHQPHQKTFHLQQQLSQEQPQESAHQENEQQLQLQQLQQPHSMLQLEHELHHEQLKREANQQEQQHLFNLQQQDNPESHSLHQQSHHSQKNQPNHPEKEQSEQKLQQPTEVSHQNSYQERQSEVLHYMKLACTFEEEESTDDPDEMVIYVSDTTDSNRENTVKEQKNNNTANSRNEINRNKNKGGDSTSHKRGNYTLYSPELRAELGKYAAEHGNQRAREYFRDILGHDVPESTIRGLRDKYILKCHVNSNAPGGINSVTSLGYSPRGRPLRLGKYDDIVKDCIQDLMQSGEKISKFLAIATAKQVLMQYEPELLVENGGSIKLTSAWAKSFLRRIGVQHDS